MKYRNGFTLIEVAVAVAIIGVLATLTVVTFTNQQTKARDSARASKVSILADSLERYYDENGEYPSVRAMLNTFGDNTGDTVASRLSLSEKSILVMPKATSGTTNSIAPSLGTDDVIAYVAQSTVGNDNCQNSVQGGCDEFTLSYKKESDGSTATIESLNKGRVNNPDTPLQPPSKPTLVASQSGTNLTATSSTPTCSSTLGTTARYSFRSQVGAGAWSAWSPLSATNPYTIAGTTNGTVFSFQVHVRCESGTFMSDTSTDSDVATVTYYTPPSAPTTPTITAGLNGSNAQGTSSTVTCNYGTPQYQIDYRTNDGTWTTGSWGTGLTLGVTATDGVKYGFRVTARCVNGTQTTTGSASTEATYVDPITAPSAPTVSSATYASPTWTWTAASCPSGTTPTYQFQFNYNDTLNFAGASTVIGSWVATGIASATNVAATSEGIQYGINVQQQCYNSYTSSGWSASASGGAFPAPMNFIQLQKWAVRLDTGGYPRLRFNTFSGTCASGAVLEMWASSSKNDGAFVNATGWFGVAPGDEKLLNGSSSYALSATGDKGEYWPHTRCRNTSTDYALDSAGSTSIDRLYNLGNMYNKGSSKFNISCGWGSAGNSWCSGGYDSSGTKNSSTASLLACGIRAGGISDSTTRFTPYTAFGTGTVCWTAP